MWGEAAYGEIQNGCDTTKIIAIVALVKEEYDHVASNENRGPRLRTCHGDPGLYNAKVKINDEDNFPRRDPM